MSSCISKFTTTFRSNWLLSSHRSGSRLAMSLPIWVSLRAAPLLRAATDLKSSRGESNSAAGAAQSARVWKEPLSMTIGTVESVWHCAGSSNTGSGEYLESLNVKILQTWSVFEAILNVRHTKIEPSGGLVSELLFLGCSDIICTCLGSTLLLINSFVL